MSEEDEFCRTCSFCGSDVGQVKHMIQAPCAKAAICEGCVGTCVEAIEQADEECDDKDEEVHVIPALLH